MPGSTLGLGVRLSATDAMSGPVGSASRSLGMLNQQALNTQQALGALQLRAGAVATAIGAGLTAAVGASVSQAAQLEDIMLTIQQKTSFTDATIREMSDDFLQLSAALPLSAQGLAKVGVIAGQLGIQTKEGIEALAFQASQLARASDFTEETGAAAMARLAKLFDLPIEQANRLGSSMVKLANTTTANASTIFEISKRFAGMARVVGISAAQANAFAATMVDAGVSSEVGGTAMTKILAAATTKTKAFAKQIGVSEAGFKQMFTEDATGTMQRFFASFQGMDRFKVQEKLKELGLSGVRVQQAVFGLAAQTEGLERNLRSSTRAFADGTALQEAFEAQTRSLNAKIDTFVGSVKNVAIAVGNTLIPIIKAVVDLGTEFLAIFLAMPQPVKFAVAAVTALAGAFFLLSGVGLIISGTISLLSVSMFQYAEAAGLAVTSNSVLGLTWTVMAAQLRGLVTGLLSGTAALWSQLVALRANLVAWLANIGGVSGLIAATGGWIAAAFASVAASFAAAGGFVGLGAAAVGAGVAIWTALAPLLPVILLIVAAVGVLFIAWKVLKPVISAAFGAVVNLLKPVFGALDLIRQGVMEVVGAFLAIFDPLADLLREAGRLKILFALVFAPILAPALATLVVLKGIARTFRFLGAIVAGAVAAVKPIFSGIVEVFETVRDALASVKESLAGVFGEAGGGAGILQGLGKALGFLVTIANPFVLSLRIAVFGLKILGNVLAGIIQGIGVLLSPVVEAVRAIIDAVQSVVDRVKEAFASAGGAGGGFLKTIQGVASFLFRAFSPLAWSIRALGVVFQIVAGVIEGAAEMVLFVLEPVFEIAATIKQAFTDLFSSVSGLFGTGAGEGLFSGLLSGIKAVARFAFKFLSPVGWILRGLGVALRVVGFVIKTVLGVVKGIFGGVFEAFGGMIDAFKSAWTSLKDAIGTIIEPLVEAWNAIKAAFGGGASEGTSFLEVLGSIGKFVIQVVLLPLRVLAFALKAAFFVVGLAVRAILFPITLLARAIGFVVKLAVGFFGAILSAGRTILRVVFAPFIAVFEAIGEVVSWLKGLFFGSSFLHLVEGLSPVLSIFGVFEKAIAALAWPFKAVAKVVEFVFGLVKKLIGVFESLFDLVKGVGSVLLAPVKAIGAAIGGVLSVGKKVAQGVFDVASGVVGTVVDMGKSVAGAIGGAVSSVVEGVGSVASSVGGAISSGVSAIGSFFGLAEGGIVTRPTVALIGEAGPEAVVPLGRRTSPLPVVPLPAPAGASASGGARGRGGGRTVEVSRVVIPITLECDGQVLARIVKELSAEELLRNFGEPRLRFAGVCP